MTRRPKLNSPLAVVRTKSGKDLTLYRDDEVPAEVTDASLKRLERLGLLTMPERTAKTPAASDFDAKSVDIATMSDDELAKFLATGKDGKALTGPETVDLARGDVELAERVIAAEQAQDGDPRGVVMGPLKKLVEGT